MALKQIKNKIISTQKTGKVTKAMESVSAVKMRKSQEKAMSSRPYIISALGILAHLAGSQDGLRHPLAVERTSKKTLLVLVTSDKGLAGSVNSAVLKKAEELLEQNKEVAVIAIGRKAIEFTKRNSIELLGEYANLSDEIEVDDVKEMASLIQTTYLQTPLYQEVVILYQNFLTTFEQQATRRKMLPIDAIELQAVMEGVVPPKGSESFLVTSSEEAQVSDYTVEPSAEEVLDGLIPQLLEIMLYHALIESKASEHSARMVAMKNATDKSKEVAKALTLEYNKERQAAITAEVSEITGGIEALKKWSK